MNALDSLMPAAFPALAFAHFVALLSPGQDFFLIAGHAIRHGLRGSRFICLGVALGNGIYIAVALFGWRGLQQSPGLFTLIELAGAAYLSWIALQLLRCRGDAVVVEGQSIPRPSASKQLLLGLNSALLNPKNALFYMSLVAVILGPGVTAGQQLFCAAWMFGVVLGWDLLVALAVGRESLRQRLGRRLWILERGAGAVLLGFAVALVVRVGGGGR